LEVLSEKGKFRCTIINFDKIAQQKKQANRPVLQDHEIRSKFETYSLHTYSPRTVTRFFTG